MATSDLPDSKRPNYPIESVDKALRVLLMVEEQRSIRVSQVSTTLGVAVSTAHRLLAMLQYYGFVKQDSDTKVYSAGPVLVRVGIASLNGMDLRGRARPELEALRRAFDETVHLIVRDGQRVMFLDGVESSKAVRVVARTGATMWAHCTSAGKSMLAQLDDDALMRLYPDEQLPGLTGRSITTRTQLLAELGKVRRQGAARNAEESEAGVGSIGVAITDRYGDVVGALSVAMPVGRMSGPGYLREITAEAKGTAERISLALS